MTELKMKDGEHVRDYARRIILNSIITLELPPGTAVSENELSASLNISRTPVREALLEMRRLELVEAFPQKGSYVTKIDYRLIEDAHFIRTTLESAVVRLACKEGISPYYLRKLQANLEQQKGCEDTPGAHYVLAELDNAFHQLLFESVDKLQAYEFMKVQMVHFDRLRNLSYLMLKNKKNYRTVDDHENILYAVQKRDDELADMVMTRHLSRHLAEKPVLEQCCPEYFK